MLQKKSDIAKFQINYRPFKPLQAISVLGLLLLPLFTAACTHTIPLGMTATVSLKPPSGKIPINVGIYYSPEFEKHEEQVWKKGDRWDFPLGDASVQLFDRAFPLLFKQTLRIQARPPLDGNLGLDAVVEPRIEAFDFHLPWLKTGTYSATISYRIIFYDKNGNAIISRVFQGIGEKPGRVGFEFSRWPGEAAELAIQDAVRKFLNDFPNQPEINIWLKKHVTQ